MRGGDSSAKLKFGFSYTTADDSKQGDSFAKFSSIGGDTPGRFNFGFAISPPTNGTDEAIPRAQSAIDQALSDKVLSPPTARQTGVPRESKCGNYLMERSCTAATRTSSWPPMSRMGAFAKIAARTFERASWPTTEMLHAATMATSLRHIQW